MSSKIEIDRNLAERLLLNNGSEQWNAQDDLRDLLAAPVAERKPVAWIVTDMNGDSYFAYDKQTPSDKALYTDPPKLAELQATVARLTAENERLKEITNFKDAVAYVFDNLKCTAANTSSKEWDEQLEDLAEAVIEYVPEYKKQWKDITRLSAEIERLKGGQGEPAYWADEFGNTIKAAHRTHNLSLGGTPAMAVEHYVTPLFTSRPAPVSAPRHDMKSVMSAICAVHGLPMLTSNQCHALANSLNACLDKVKELNAPHPQHHDAPADSGTHPHNDGLDDYRGKP